MDKIAVASLAVGAVGALAAAVAAVFAYLAPTKKDLQRVEEHTATTSERLEKVNLHIASVDSRLNEQHAHDLLIAKAQRVSIAVNGTNKVNDPLELRLALQAPDITLNHIELFNEVGTFFGSASCSQIGPLLFSAFVESDTLQRWFSGGTSDQSINRKRLRMRAHMVIEEREAYRDFAVHIFQTVRAGIDRTHPSEQVYILEGSS